MWNKTAAWMMSEGGASSTSADPCVYASPQQLNQLTLRCMTLPLKRRKLPKYPFEISTGTGVYSRVRVIPFSPKDVCILKSGNNPAGG